SLSTTKKTLRLGAGTPPGISKRNSMPVGSPDLRMLAGREEGAPKSKAPARAGAFSLVSSGRSLRFCGLRRGSRALFPDLVPTQTLRGLGVDRSIFPVGSVLDQEALLSGAQPPRDL